MGERIWANARVARQTLKLWAGILDICIQFSISARSPRKVGGCNRDELSITIETQRRMSFKKASVGSDFALKTCFSSLRCSGKEYEFFCTEFKNPEPDDVCNCKRGGALEVI